MRYANRKDVVHKPIVEGLRKYGIIVAEMPQPGDILCYGRHRVSEQWTHIPMEIKSDPATRGYKPELTPSQERRARTMPIPIVHDAAEALALFGIQVD